MALQGFVESEYLAAKLAALQTETAWVGQTTEQLKTFLANAGFTPESHYQEYGWTEGLAPNTLFNAAEYKLAKATDMYNNSLATTTPYATIALAQAAFDAAWPADPYLHYVQYGSSEGINPSNDFDESSYFASKLTALQADAATSADWAGKTVADLQAAFAAAGLSALGHYEAYGKTEGVAVTAVPADEAVDASTNNPGLTFTLTNSATPDTVIGTAGDDTINGPSGTVANGDLIIDQTTTDNDTANLVITAAYTPANITNVENVNVDWNAFGTASLVATGITGAQNITLTSSKTGFLGSANVTAGAGQTITAGTGMVGTLTITGATTALTVNGGAAKAISATGTGTATVTAGVSTTSVATSGFSTATVDAGTATSVSVTDAAVATNTTALTVNAAAVALTNGTTGILNLTASDDNNVTVSAIGASLDVAGTGDVTITSGALTTKTLTNSKTAGTLTVVNTAAGAALNVFNVAADVIDLSVATNDTVTAANGANFKTAINQTSAVFTDGATTPAATNALTITNTAVLQTSITSTNFSTLNVVSNAAAITGTDATYTLIGNGTRTVNLTGTNDVVVTGGTAGTFNAAGLTGNLTYTQATAVAGVVSGATGTNTVVFKAVTVDASYTGQDGIDNVTFVNTSGNATAVLGNGANTVTSAAGTTGSFVVIGGDGVDTITAATAGDGTGEVNLNLGAGNDVMAITTGAAATTNILTIDAGAGNDSLTLAAATVASDVFTLAMGDGTDTLNIATDLTAGTWAISGLETIAIGSSDTAAIMNGTELTGQSYTITGDGTAADHMAVEMDVAGTLDLSAIIVNQTLTKGLAGLDITGSGANDTIVGTNFADIITGGAGTNTITGGQGVDVMTSAGTDTFVFAAGDTGKTTLTADRIVTFATTADKISMGLAASVTNFSILDTNTGGTDQIATVELAVTAADAVMNGTILYVYVTDSASGVDSYLCYDSNADGTTDMVVEITGIPTAGLAQADIVA